MTVEPGRAALSAEPALFQLAAIAVLDEIETWVEHGLPSDTALALAQNALPLTGLALTDIAEPAGAEPDTALQQRSHARVLAALLLAHLDSHAGALATDLLEALAV